MNRLDVINLTKKYGDKYALKNFSFTISDGEIVGLLGKSNAGKTTLLNCIAGNIIPDSGELIFNGINLLNHPHERKSIGILVEASFIDYLSAYENFQALMYISGSTRSHANRETIEKTLAAVDLQSFKEKLVAGFSFGTKQKLGFAQTLLNGQKMLILDEPFAGLDAQSRRIVKDKIKNIVATHNIGVLISEHTLDNVKDICDRVICIEHGQKIYDGIMSDETIYYITVDRVAPDMLSLLPEAGSTVDEVNNTIQVIGNSKLSDILKLIAGFSNILKIESTQDSLAKFLKEG